jgi:K+-transporting ATPase KdpF subunit
MNTVFLSLLAGISQNTGYVIGMTIAVIILGYLVYALSKPEKF